MQMHELWPCLVDMIFLSHRRRLSHFKYCWCSNCDTWVWSKWLASVKCFWPHCRHSVLSLTSNNWDTIDAVWRISWDWWNLQIPQSQVDEPLKNASKTVKNAFYFCAIGSISTSRCDSVVNDNKNTNIAKMCRIPPQFCKYHVTEPPALLNDVFARLPDMFGFSSNK